MTVGQKLKVWFGSQQDVCPSGPVEYLQAHCNTGDKRGFDDVVLKRDDKVLVTHRRLFQQVQPRFFIDIVVTCQDRNQSIRTGAGG